MPFREVELEGGYTVGKVSNNYSPALTGNGFSYVAAASYRFGRWAVKIDARSDQFTTVDTVPGGVGYLAPDGTYEILPPFTGRNTSLDERLEHTIFGNYVYAGLSYNTISTTYGSPAIHGLGAGVEQYCDFTPFQFCGFIYYYPSLSGVFHQTYPTSPNFGKSYNLNYGGVKISAESALALAHGLYLYFGYSGYVILQSATSAKETERVTGPFVGIGTRLFRAGGAGDEPDVTRLAQTTPAYPGFVQGAVGFWGANTGGGNNGLGTYQLGGAYQTGKFAIDANLHAFSYPPTNLQPGSPAPASIADTFVQEDGLLSVTGHGFYLGAGLMQKTASAGYSSQFGWGLGGEKLPNLTQRYSVYGSVFYYLTLPAQYTTMGKTTSGDRRYLVYDYGLTYRPAKKTYLYAGYWGYHGNFGNLPIDEVHADLYTGLGYRL